MKKLTAAFVVAAMLLAAPAAQARVFKKLAIVAAAVAVGTKALAKHKKERNEQVGRNGQSDKN